MPLFKLKDLLPNEEYWLGKIQNEICCQLKNYIESNNWDEGELAKQLNISRHSISQILKGSFNPRIKNLVKLSLAMGRIPKIEFDSVEEALNLGSTNKEKREFLEWLSKEDYFNLTESDIDELLMDWHFYKSEKII